MMRWLTVVLLGLALGFGTAATNAVVAGSGASPAWQVAAVVLNAATVWGGLALFTGWMLADLVSAAIGGVVAVAAAVLGYLVYGWVFEPQPLPTLPGVQGELVYLGVVVAIAAAIIGVVGALMRWGGPIGFLAAMLVPVGALIEVFWVQRLSPATFQSDPLLAWGQAGLVLAAVAAGVGAGYATRR